MGTILASIGGWALRWLLGKLSGSAIGDALSTLADTPDGQAKVEEVKSATAIALEHEDTERARLLLEARTTRQLAKFNQPVFWIIICVMMGPPALLLWSVAIYNILWWQHGIWPQGWAIADFPASIKPWVAASIDWLYDPLGAPATIGTAGAVSWLTGRR